MVLRRTGPRPRALALALAQTSAALLLVLFALLVASASAADPPLSLSLPTEFGEAAPALMRKSELTGAAPPAPAAALPAGGWAPAAQAVATPTPTPTPAAGARPAAAAAAATSFAPAEPATPAPLASPKTKAPAALAAPKRPAAMPGGYTPLWMADPEAVAVAKEQAAAGPGRRGGGGGGAVAAARPAALLKALAKRATDPTGELADESADYAVITGDSEQQQPEQQQQRPGLLSLLKPQNGKATAAEDESAPADAGAADAADATATAPSGLRRRGQALVEEYEDVEESSGSNLRVASAGGRQAAAAAAAKEAAAPVAAPAASGGAASAGKLLASLGSFASMLSSASGGGGGAGGEGGGSIALAGLAGALGGALRNSGGGGESGGLGGGGGSGSGGGAAAALKAAAGQGAAGAAAVAKGLATVLGLPTDLPDKAPDLPTAKQALAGVLASVDLSKVDLNDVAGSLQRLSGGALGGLDAALAGAGQSATDYVSQLSANMKPPKLAISGVEATRFATYGWNVTQALSGVVNGRGAGSGKEEGAAAGAAGDGAAAAAAAAAGEGEADDGATSAETAFDAAAVVGRTVTVARYEKRASWRVRGTITISNVNIVPLVVSGLAVTVASGGEAPPATLAAASAASAAFFGNGGPPRRASSPGAAPQIVTRVVADCPAASETSDTIVVPGTPLSSLMPGKLECTFEATLPGDAPADTEGKITAALSVALLPSLSGQVAPAVPFSLVDAKLEENGACASVTDTYYADAGAAARAVAGLEGGAGVDALAGGGQLGAPQLAPTAIAAGDKPPSEDDVASGKAKALRVCEPTRTFLYAAAYGPFGNERCGAFASTNVVRVVPDGAESGGNGNGNGAYSGDPSAFAAGLAGLLGIGKGSMAAMAGGEDMGMGGGKEGGGEFPGAGGAGPAPTGGVSSATLPVSVTGCLPVVVASVAPRLIRRYAWDAQQQAAAVTPLGPTGGGGGASSSAAAATTYGGLGGGNGGGDGSAFWAAPGSSLPLGLTVRFTRSAEVRHVLTGSVVLTNPTFRFVTAQAATVSAGPAGGGGARTLANLLPGCVRADGSTFTPSAVLVPPASQDGTPGSLTCRFRLELPAGEAGEVFASATYADDPLGKARQGAPSKYSFDRAPALEVGKCADVRVAFDAPEGAGLMMPRALAGALPPGLAASADGGGARICAPTAFSFRATFGPMEGGCGSARAARLVATAKPVAAGGAPAAMANALASRAVRRALPVGVAVAGGACGPVVPAAAGAAAASAALAADQSGGGGGASGERPSGMRLAAEGTLLASMAKERAAEEAPGADGSSSSSSRDDSSSAREAKLEAASAAAAFATAAPVSVKISSLTPGVVAAAYTWSVRAGTSPAGPALSVEPGGSAALSRAVIVRRSDQAAAVTPTGAAGYALSGTVAVTNPSLSPLPPLARVTVSVRRPAVAGAKGVGGGTSLEVPTTCAPGAVVQPGQTLECAFAVAYPDTVASRAVATAEFLVADAPGGGGSDGDGDGALALPAPGATAVPKSVRSEPAKFFFDRPRAVIAGECASVTDDLELVPPSGVALGGGLGAAPSSAAALLTVLDDGMGAAAVKAPSSADLASGAAAPLRLCGGGDRTFRYQVLLGPLGGAGRCFGVGFDDGQGQEQEQQEAPPAYVLRARAAAAPLVAGAAAAVPSAALLSSVAEAGRGQTTPVGADSELVVELSGC